MIHGWMCVECSTCLMRILIPLEHMTKLWQAIRVCAYLSTHIRFTFTLYTMNSTQENHLSQFELDCNKTRMSVRWHEPTAGGMSFCWTRILLQQNRQKENLWNHLCGINRGCFLFYDEYSWRMWYVTQRASQDDRTPEQPTPPSAHPSFICSQHLDLLICTCKLPASPQLLSLTSEKCCTCVKNYSVI